MRNLSLWTSVVYSPAFLTTVTKHLAERLKRRKDLGEHTVGGSAVEAAWDRIPWWEDLLDLIVTENRQEGEERERGCTWYKKSKGHAHNDYTS